MMRRRLSMKSERQSVLLKNRIVLLLLLAPLPAFGQSENRVVRIQAFTPKGTKHGSGYFYGDEATVITAYHVIHGAKKIIVKPRSGSASNPVRIKAAYPALDLVLLEIEEKVQNASPLATALLSEDIFTSQDRVSLKIMAYPYQFRTPHSLKGESSRGYTSSSDFVIDNEKIFVSDIMLIPFDMTVYNGMSGAPVFYKNRIVGILSGSLETGGGIAWAVPLNYPEYFERSPSRFEGRLPESIQPGEWNRVKELNPDFTRSTVMIRNEPLPEFKFNLSLNGGYSFSTETFFSSAELSLKRNVYKYSLSYGLGAGYSYFPVEYSYALLSGTDTVSNSYNEHFLSLLSILSLNHFKGRLLPYLGGKAGINYFLSMNHVRFAGQIFAGFRILPGLYFETAYNYISLPVETVEFSLFGSNSLSMDFLKNHTLVAGLRYEF